jgi:hypothetical protein
LESTGAECNSSQMTANLRKTVLKDDFLLAEGKMATSPRVPNPREPQRKGPVLVQRAEPPTSSTPGVILAIVTAVLLLGAILYFMPRAPKGTNTTLAQPGGSLLSVSGLRMSEAPTSGAINLDGQLTNSGSTAVSGLMVEVVFRLTNGLRASIERPVQGAALGNEGKQAGTGKVTGDTEDLTKTPIKPGETRSVRIAVDQLPKAWNHQIPQIRVVETTGQ